MDSHNHSNGSNKRSGKYSQRHTPQQVAGLEQMFRECPHPDDFQRYHLAKMLGLNPQQVKFWFQNRRTQLKTQVGRLNNGALQMENELLRAENMYMLSTLKSAFCASCSGHRCPEEHAKHRLELLKMENAELLQEHERLSKLFTRVGVTLSPTINQKIPNLNPLSTQGFHVPAFHPSNAPIPVFNPTAVASSSSSPPKNPEIAKNLREDDFLAFTMSKAGEIEKAYIEKTANVAIDELVRLLTMNEPLWFTSLLDDKFILQHNTYEAIFKKNNYVKGSHARVESSKETRLVNISATLLVEMFLNSDKWVDLFPTIVVKAETVEVFESGFSESGNGPLMLMKAEMHILSPMVPTREFLFIRHCKKIDTNTYVIVDVSYDSSKLRSNHGSNPRVWRRPSGCLIQQLGDSLSNVTWVEHVEVDDKIHKNKLFRKIICDKTGYGAERWVVALERMCERIASASIDHIPTSDSGEIISTGEERKRVMKLSQRMVNMFCRTLDMSQRLDFPQMKRDTDGGIKVAVRNSTEPGLINGLIITAATSFFLPPPPHVVVNYLKDNNTRLQWDVLFYGNQAVEIHNISTGIHTDNCISIIRPFIPSSENIHPVLILQEAHTDSLGSMLVYAPVNIELLNLAMKGVETSLLPILPSGFTISGDGKANVAAGLQGGSLVTLAYHILLNSTSNRQVECTVSSINALVTSTVEKIREGLKCSGTFVVD